MVARIPEVAAEIALADVALAAGDPLACGDHLGRAYLHLRQRRYSASADDVYAAGLEIMIASLQGWVPALLAYAGTVRSDRKRWEHYREAQRALLCVLRSCEVMPGYAPDDLATLRDYCAPFLEGTEIAIGATLA
jgi:hypothetical protein